VIATETGVSKTVDPIGGSYYVENLTSRIEDEVQNYLRKIDRMGGALAAIEKGYFQEEIRRNAYNMKKEIDTNKRIIVGVNKFQDSSNIEPKLNIIDTEIESKQKNKLKTFRDSRDKLKFESAISSLEKAAEKKEENLMPYIIDAVKNKATLGEISNSFRAIFGTFEPKISF
jgi:methylmalonyl-CoA mutase N-terminal domain/subunit